MTKYFYLVTLAILLLHTFVCCKENTSSSIVYVGGSRAMDQTIPFPYIIYKANDTLVLANNKGQKLGHTLKTELHTGDTLALGKRCFYVTHEKNNKFFVFDLKDTLNFRHYKDGSPVKKDVASFVKAEETTLTINTQNLKNLLKNHIWKYEVTEAESPVPNRDLKVERKYNFSEENVAQLTEYFYQNQFIYSESQEFNYEVLNIKEKLFLSFMKGKDNPQPIFQLIDIQKNDIELKDFSFNEPKSIFLSKDLKTAEPKFNELITKSKKYASCFDGYQGEYYFGDDITFNKGNNFIINYVNKNAPLDNTNQNGYIIVHFHVNCNGKVGNFGLIQMTRDYQPTLFSEKLIAHLIHKVSKLNDWPSTQTIEDWLRYKDVHAFLMFKLEGGKIIDLCP